MRNEHKKESQRFMALITQLPYFTVDNVRITGIGNHYLRVLLSRQVKARRVMRLKRGLYVSQHYVDTVKASGRISSFIEFLACTMYQPSYLSCEYVLHRHNMLTDVPQNFILMTRKKTARFSNVFGNFLYHSLHERLFTGFESRHEGQFLILQATKAKALFDFLYVRKNLIWSKEEFDALRLNCDVLSARDRKELKAYVRLEGSAKMRSLFSFV